jgi:hypothetical protein
MLKCHQSRLTLSELAIALVTVGLLLGVALKGQEIIDKAMVTSLETDFINIPLFINGYQGKFKALPGDDQNAASHVGGTLATTPVGLQGNGVIDGHWNSTTATDEPFLLWQHIRLAGLASGPASITDRTYAPINAAGGSIGVQSGTATSADSPINGGQGQSDPIRGDYIICSAAILGKYAKKIDIAMDDGNTATGSMMATPTHGYAVGASVATATAAIMDATPYTVCMGFQLRK